MKKGGGESLAASRYIVRKQPSEFAWRYFALMCVAHFFPSFST